MRRHCFSMLVSAAAFTLSPSSASAQDDHQPSVTTPSTTTDTLDSVYLRNGGLHRGRVSEIVVNDHDTIIVEGQGEMRIAWSAVDQIITSSSPRAPEPPQQAAISVGGRSEKSPIVSRPPRTQWQANQPLLVTGAILSAAGYGSSVMAATPSTVALLVKTIVHILIVDGFCGAGVFSCNSLDAGAIELLIPFAGPILFANKHPRDIVLNPNGAVLSTPAKGLLYTSAVLQIAGVTSILGAIVFGAKEPLPTRKAIGPSFYVAPLDAPASLGVSIGVHRW